MLAMHGVVDRMYRYDIAEGASRKSRCPTTRGPVPRGQERHPVRAGPQRQRAVQHQHEAAGRGLAAADRQPGAGRGARVVRDAEVVRYQSFDGLEIEALLFRPDPAKANGYTVVWPHGGPQWAERKSYRSLFQILWPPGYVVFAPNFRGSIGYGTRFMKLVERDWGHGPRLDNIAGVEWLIGKALPSVTNFSSWAAATAAT